MNNSICTLFDNILIDIHKFKSLQLNVVSKDKNGQLKEVQSQRETSIKSLNYAPTTVVH